MFREDADDTGIKPMSPAVAHSGTKDIGWQALGPTIACTILATAVVVLRWYTRRRLVRCTGLDDYVILVSLLLSWGMCCVITAANGEGLGVYDGFIDATHLAKLLTASNILWALTVNITKASILLQYLRVFSCHIIRILSYILLSLLVLAACWAVFGGTFICRPIAKLWVPSLPGTCLNAEVYWTSVAGINIGLDFFVLLLPVPAITSLCLPPKEKLCIVLVFTLGFFICVVSSLRLSLVVATANKGDHVFSGIWAIIWSSVEANVGIICASLLALKPFIYATFPRLMRENNIPRNRMRLPSISQDTKATESEPSSESTILPKPSGSLNRFDTPMSGGHTVRNAQETGIDLEAGDLSVMDMLRIGPSESTEGGSEKDGMI